MSFNILFLMNILFLYTKNYIREIHTSGSSALKLMIIQFVQMDLVKSQPALSRFSAGHMLTQGNKQTV